MTKIRVIRILEYEFENEHTYEEHTSRWTHGMKTTNMSMKSAVLPIKLLTPEGTDLVDKEQLDHAERLLYEEQMGDDL